MRMSMKPYGAFFAKAMRSSNELRLDAALTTGIFA